MWNEFHKAQTILYNSFFGDCKNDFFFNLKLKMMMTADQVQEAVKMSFPT